MPKVNTHNWDSWYQQFEIDGELTTPKGYMNNEYFDQLSILLPDHLQGALVVDLGCNAGFVSIKLAEMGAMVIGVEKSSKYLDQAAFVIKKLNPNTLYPIEFLQKDISEVDLHSMDPELIMALSCIYHTSDPEKMIKKLSATNARIIASFRAKDAAHYQMLFMKYNRPTICQAFYGKKYAYLL